MEIERSIDIEDAVRLVLSDYFNAYCRPLPENYRLPNLLITHVGGTLGNGLSTFEVVIDARAATDYEAVEYLHNAVGVLRSRAGARDNPIRHVAVISSGSWGSDPVRPDLSMYSARLEITAHLEQKTINK